MEEKGRKNFYARSLLAQDPKEKQLHQILLGTKQPSTQKLFDRPHHIPQSRSMTPQHVRQPKKGKWG